MEFVAIWTARSSYSAMSFVTSNEEKSQLGNGTFEFSAAPPLVEDLRARIKLAPTLLANNVPGVVSIGTPDHKLFRKIKENQLSDSG